MSLTLWLQYVVLEILLSLCPGPAVFTVIAQGIKHGGRKSIFGNLGICTGNGIYFLLSALGLGAMIAARPAIYLSLRWGGIAYLLYTAVRLLLAHAESASGIRAAEGRPGALYRQAVITQLSNPKTIIFFVALLAPFIDPKRNVPWQIFILACTTMVFEFPILLMYGYGAAHGSKLLPEGKVGLWQDRIAGICLATAAVFLALNS
jgi:homoserine/homoserine lactone efflux protein